MIMWTAKARRGAVALALAAGLALGAAGCGGGERTRGRRRRDLLQVLGVDLSRVHRKASRKRPWPSSGGRMVCSFRLSRHSVTQAASSL